MAQKFTDLKQKISEIVASPLCSGNVSKDWAVDNIKELDLLVMFMISVLAIMILKLITLKIFISI